MQGSVTERWLPVVGYEGFYEVSDTGNIRGLDRSALTVEGWTQHVKGITLKQKDTKDGYKEVTLQRNGKAHSIRVHRIVAMAFIGEPQGEAKEVNHKDGNKKNNNVSNLEWVTSSENQIHAYKMGLQKPCGNAVNGRKWIVCITLGHVEHGYNAMQRWLCKMGYTKSPRLNRLSGLANQSKTFKYLGLEFSTREEDVERWGKQCKNQ